MKAKPRRKKKTFVYINGKFHDKENAKISVFDHGLLYGDGVFEGIRVYNGRVFKLVEHIDRLYESAKTIMLKIPLSRKRLISDVLKTARRNNLKDAYIRLVVTRGIGTLGLSPFKCLYPQIIIIADKIQLYPGSFYKKGLKVITVPTQRNRPEAMSPRVKSLNYLNNIMAKIEAVNSGVHEAIMLNSYGFVAECTGDNIFIVRKGVLLTPSIYMGVLEGVTRNTVMALARKHSIEVKQIVMSRHDVFNADECFLTGTAAEIVPVIECDKRIIGDGKPGSVTKKLMNLYGELTNTSGEEIY
ncbi:MAG: branched-chain-amino-acid transaminase [Candidatus Auribacterota bacterium]|nr:branched-chain-amino-acid transaminase [Candidatus Auribacterota bacterium]